MAKEQKTEVYYCKVNKKEQIFITHADNPNKWVCTICGFTTTTPKKSIRERPMTMDELAEYYKNKRLHNL